MFPFHHSTDDELFQICSTTHQQDQIFGLDSIPETTNLTNNNNMINTTTTTNCNNIVDANDIERKKIMRRDIERKRRKEMGDLCSALRSQLPLEYIKGKRSLSDHISEAANYIKQLEKNIEELSGTRDELRKKSAGSSCLISEDGSSSQGVMVFPCLEGVKIVFNSGFNEERLLLSKVMKVLLEEGLSVVSCVSTKVNEKLLHTIESEVKDFTCFNLSELQRKLNMM